LIQFFERLPCRWSDGAEQHAGHFPLELDFIVKITGHVARLVSWYLELWIQRAVFSSVGEHFSCVKNQEALSPNRTCMLKHFLVFWPVRPPRIRVSKMTSCGHHAFQCEMVAVVPNKLTMPQESEVASIQMNGASPSSHLWMS
jgi:hypothetical protein